VFRRGDWYARKETRRGDEIGILRQASALRRHVFALCHPFQDDYQSSCGLTTVSIIAKLRAFVRRMPPTARSRPANSRPLSGYQPPLHYTHPRRRNDSKIFPFQPILPITAPIKATSNRHPNRDCPHFIHCFLACSPIFCNLSLFLVGTVPKTGHGNTPNWGMSFADKNIRH
jgi:hypothetical protein